MWKPWKHYPRWEIDRVVEIIADAINRDDLDSPLPLNSRQLEIYENKKPQILRRLLEIT